MVSVPVDRLFSVAGMPITNSMINAWLALAVFVVLAILLRKPAEGAPRGVRNAAEAALEFMLGFMDQVTGDRAKSRKFFPLVGTLFLFILLSNWMGLLPGVGTFGLREGEHLIPMFRPATSDLNMTLAMALTAVIVSHVLGVVTVGLWGHANKFIQINNIVRAFAKLPKLGLKDGAIGLFAAFVEFAVGLIELVSEAAKVVSLSLRLFGNIFAGEVLLHVISSLIAFVVPLPFMAMELIVGVVQAMVFSVLTLVYLSVATSKPHGEEHEEGSHGADPETAEAVIG